MSEPLRRVEGIVMPLWRANVDTDAIVPINYCINRVRPHFGEGLFRRWRYRADGSQITEFPFNQTRYRDAAILVAAENFGCGSSREKAVWALHDAGFRCVIAPSFGEIFFNNCFQNGLLPLVLARDLAEELARRADAAEQRVAIDLERGVIEGLSEKPRPFEMNELRRQSLLQGLDPIAATLKLREKISEFQKRDRNMRPWVHRRAPP